MDFEKITKDTYTTIAKDYCHTTPSHEVRLAIIESLYWFCKFVPRKSEVLVLGAGDGRDAEVLSGIGYRPVLIDYCAEMIALSKERLPNNEIILGDITQLNSYFENRKFDGIWGSACLYHLTKSHLKDTISSLFQMLNQNGVFYMNLRRGKGEELLQRPRSYPNGGPRFYAFYDQGEVLDMVADFEILKFLAVHPVLKEDYFQVWLKKGEG